MYNDSILWPKSIDTFPTVRDSSGSTVRDDQIFYAQHYNKLGNAIKRMQKLLHDPSKGVSDGSVVGMVNPYTFYANIPWLAATVSPELGGSNSKWPGNVLPFEFIYTFNNTDDYSKWKLPDGPIAYTRNKTTFETQLNGGYDYSTTTPNIQVGLFTELGAHVGTVTQLNPAPLINYHVAKGADTLIVRGAVIDPMVHNNPYDLNDYERWEYYLGFYIYCSYGGVV